MGLFDRFKRVVKSNLNDMVSKAENPEKMLNQLIQDMNQQMIESKKSVASAIADEKKIERQVNEQRNQANEWEKKAMMALKAGKEDLAREALTRKQEHEQYADELHEQWEQQHQSVQKLKESLRGLQQKIEEAQRKKNLLIARSKRAEAQKKIQQTVSGMSNTSAFEVFDRMSAKVDQIEAEAEAAGQVEDWTSKGGDSMEAKFKELEGSGSSQSTDRMLEDLKQRMALEEDAGKAASGDSGNTSGSGDSGESGNSGGSGDSSQSSSGEDESLAELKKKMQDESEGKS